MPECYKCKHMKAVYSRRKKMHVSYCELLKTAADDNPFCVHFEEYDINDLRM